jgi:opacity protein-like surface antigen
MTKSSTRIFNLIALSLVFLSISPLANAQKWKNNRSEILIGVGASNFLGELGGGNNIAKPFIFDMNLAATRPSFNIGYLYRILENSRLRANLTYGVLSGDDKLTNEPFRNNRNLHFRSDLIEFSGMYELNFNKERSNRFGVRGSRGFKTAIPVFYGFAGIGGFYFNPQAQFDGKWHDLKPLKTEGQGLADGPAEYSNFSIAIPMGLGVRYNIANNLKIGAEMSFRKTFTDYIDDVSTNYYDNSKIKQNTGELAANIADPNKGNFAYQLDQETGKSRHGIQRGNPDSMDSYMFFMVNLSFTISGKSYRYKF